PLDRMLAYYARRQSGCRTLIARLYGVGPVTATAIVAELGDARRFGCSDDAVRHLRPRRDRASVGQQARGRSPLTVEQNVALPLRLAGRRAKRAEVRSVLERVGLESRRRHRRLRWRDLAFRRDRDSRLATRPEARTGPRPNEAEMPRRDPRERLNS